MNEFLVKNDVFIKRDNDVYKIYSKYTISLIIFTVLSLLCYLLFGYTDIFISYTKSIVLSLVIASIIGYIFSLIKGNNNFIDIYKVYNVHIIGIIIGLFGINTNIVVLGVSLLISLILRYFIKNMRLSSTLYGILIILIYKYYMNDMVSPLISFKNMNFFGTKEEVMNEGIKSYIIGINYLNPFLAVISFIYLFYKKIIKYSIVYSYFLTFFMLMFLYGIFNGMNIWHVFFQITTGSILFMIVYILPDYGMTPTISEGQVVYGMILGIMSFILRFIIPEMAILISLILGNILISHIIEKVSPNFKYHHRIYSITIIVLVVISIASLAVLTI